MIYKYDMRKNKYNLKNTKYKNRMVASLSQREGDRK